jgi:hypothetical protein
VLLSLPRWFQDGGPRLKKLYGYYLQTFIATFRLVHTSRVIPITKYQCKVCGRVYNPAIGDPDSHIPAGKEAFCRSLDLTLIFRMGLLMDFRPEIASEQATGFMSDILALGFAAIHLCLPVP